MKKRNYLSPTIKVVKITAHRMLCGSYDTKQQNESYDEVETTTTDSWFN